MNAPSPDRQGSPTPEEIAEWSPAELAEHLQRNSERRATAAPEVFFTCDDTVEELQHRDRDAAIEYHLDGLDPALDADLLATPLKVYRYQRRVVCAHFLDHAPGIVLENLLEDLDEDYGAPGGEGTATTPAMEAAARAFVAAVVADYRVWSCEKIGEEEVDAAVWVVEHHPEWLAATPDLTGTAPEPPRLDNAAPRPERCPAHFGEFEPCPICAAYITAGL